ncbi:MAG: type II secretion system F family protein [Planctomycetota bacterium]
MAAVLWFFTGAILLGGVGAIAIALHRSQLATRARGILFDQAARASGNAELAEESVVYRQRRSPVLRRYWLYTIPLIGVLIGLACWLLPIPWPYLLAFSVMLVLCVDQVDVIILQRRILRLEQQLADSIDMMVAGVKSGASLQSALESSVLQAKKPWRRESDQLIQAIRYGEDPVNALGDLSERLPLESVNLFCQTLAVNWRVGGRLAITLANVGRTVRDRIELSRRMTAMTTQARLSVLSVLVVTYFIGALIWRNDPERMSGFLTSIVGQWMVASAMLLQSVGIVWISWMSKPRF